MLTVQSKLLRKWKSSDKFERCGLILSSLKVIETKNISETPEDSFEIPPEDMLREDIIGTWHTHLKTDANLSNEDYAGFLQWPKLRHWIVAKDKDVRSFIVDSGVVVNG